MDKTHKTSKTRVGICSYFKDFFDIKMNILEKKYFGMNFFSTPKYFFQIS